jgi:hypothetical protein
MNREQINHLYANAPILLWPWLWVQIVVILARLEAASLRGEDSMVLIGVTKWYALHILYESDNLLERPPAKPFSYTGRVTFASLCETPETLWDTQTPLISHHTAPAAPSFYTCEYAEALRPVP